MIDLARAAGKYGAYIWPAYGATVLGLFGMIVESYFRSRHWRGEVDRLRRAMASDERDERSGGAN